MPNNFKNPFLQIFVFVVVGVILGGLIGGLVAERNKKIKEKAEQPLQAQKTKEAKLKAQEALKSAKIELPKIQKWEVYENKDYRYKIKYPKGWFISKKETPWLLNLTSYNPKNVKDEEVPGVKVEILVQGNPQNLSLKEWVEEGHQLLGKPKFSQELTISGFPAIWEELDFMGQMVNVTFLRQGEVFTLSYTGRAAEYEQYKQIFWEMVRKMEVGK